MPSARASQADFDDWMRGQPMRLLRRFPGLDGLMVVEVMPGEPADAMAQRIWTSGLVEYAEVDGRVHAWREPNDPAFRTGDLWELGNPPKDGNGTFGIGAVEAWETTTTATNVIVAIVDSGCRVTHEDLVANLWRNPREIPGNGIDDDGNGWIDDVHGIDSVDNDGSPDDKDGHGTHVAGIIGASGDNERGRVGVAWRVQLMPLKFLDKTGSGSTSDVIACFEYARVNGARIVNASWGGAAFSRSLQRSIQRLQAAGIVLVVAAGNSAEDVDRHPDYPASFGYDNIVTVAATDARGEFSEYSSYGVQSIDLAAPGDAIYSCWSTSDTAYVRASGTSMSTPLVSGVFALLAARFPEKTYHDWIDAVVGGVLPRPDLAGRVASGGILSAPGALTRLLPHVPRLTRLTIGTSNLDGTAQMKLSGEPGSPYEIEFSEDLVDWQFLESRTTDNAGQLSLELGTTVHRQGFLRARLAGKVDR